MDAELQKKIDRYWQLMETVDCVNEIIIDIKTPEELEEMHKLREELEKEGVKL